VRIQFDRAKERKITRAFAREPTNKVRKIQKENTTIDDFEENDDVVKIVSEHFDNIEDLEGFDYGINYDWSVPTIPLTKNQDDNVETFLSSKLEQYEKDLLSEKIQLPHKADGSTYEMSQLTDEQSSIICYFLDYIKHCSQNKTKYNIPQLHITLRGIAGSGKSTLILTLVTALKRMFQMENCVMLCAPTGCAAFNIGGATCHNELHITPGNDIYGNPQISNTNIKKLRDRMENLFLFIIDERSMISADLLAIIESRFRECMHNGNFNNSSWGKLPMFLLVGDDYQLPSIQKGMIYSFDKTCKHSAREVIGYNIFKRTAQQAFELTTSQRQNLNQKRFNEFLKYARGEDEEINKTFADFNLVLDMILNTKNFTQEQIQFLENDPETLHLFANKIPKEDYNKKRLNEIHDSENPIAVFKSRLSINYSNQTTSTTTTPNEKHFNCQTTPFKTFLCRNALVQITSRNIMPMWGLYNGSFGTVKDLVFKKNENPNCGHLPKYVIVEFGQYNGPPFIPEFPKYVPLVPVSVVCKKRCCMKYYIPLSLSFAKTVHTFQGQNVGGVEDGKQKNSIKRIIVDPGNRGMEGINPGILYTISSRGTNMGEMQKMKSAVYFFGDNISIERLQNLRISSTGDKYKKVILRDTWVKWLKNNTKNPFFKTKDKVDLIQWAQNIKFTKRQVWHMKLTISS